MARKEALKPFDAHCHLDSENFKLNQEEVIERAKKVLSGILNLGLDPISNRATLELAKKYPGFIYAALAIHPTSIHEFTDEQIEEEINFIRKNKKKIIAIGEAGLDYKWIKKVLPAEIGKENAAKQEARQIKWFREFIRLANELDIPIIIHSRWGAGKVIEILEEEKPKKAVLHRFGGTVEQMKQGIKLGCKISLSPTAFTPPPVEYLNELDIDACTVETDAPYMQYCGKPSEPVNVLDAVKELANLKKISEEDVIKITNKNIKELFGIKF